VNLGGNVNQDTMKVVYNLGDNLKYTKNLLRDYWLNSSGKFIAKVTTLLEAYRIEIAELNSLIASSGCQIDFGDCCACNHGNLHPVKNRTEAIQIYENEIYHYFCSSCRIKAEEFCRNLNKYDRKIIWMKLSFKYKLWTKLEKDELNFLKSLYFLKDWNRIYHELILLDIDNHFRILFKLDKMNLIYYRKNESRENKIKMMESLQNLIRQKKI
jgi:hypothetical protein